ncbi:hypothetical protein, partial [Rhodococcus rhodochrous]|uniref:hypothetical protein n=1 Tax=Rhodococcus rhodochrous TaxID=1829 RepID=UPI000A7AD34F
FIGHSPIKKMFLDAAQAMVRESGVEVVMSAGGLFALLSATDTDLQLDGAMIANPTYLAVRQAELAVSVARATGMPVSRGGTFARATPRAVEELLTLIGRN